MSIDQRLLLALTDEVDQLHHESMRTFRAEAEEIHFGEPAEELRESRRGLFRKVGAGAALLTVGAMTNPLSWFVPVASAKDLDDAAIAKFAASVEFAAVAAYEAAIASDKLSATVRKVAVTFQGHHREHGRAFNAITKETSEKPNAKLLAELKPKLKGAANQNALLEIVYTIEEGAAATYLFALGALQDKSNAKATATILPVESQHAVVLAQILNKKLDDYMPSFQNDKQALSPTDYAV